MTNTHRLLLPILLNICVMTCIYLHMHIIFVAIICSIAIILLPLPYSKTLTIFLICGLCLSQYINYQTSQRSTILNTYATKINLSFNGKLTYLHDNTGKLKLNNGFTLVLKFKKNNQSTPYQIGDTISVTGTYIPPKKPHNPGQFNAYHYAITHQQCGLLHVKQSTLLTKSSTLSLLKCSSFIKKQIINQYNQSLPSPYNSIYGALLFGESYTNLSYKLKQTFKKAGLLHALVVSGSQVSLVLSMLTNLLNFCGIYRGYQWWILIPTGLLFYLVAGPGAAILRAILMAACLILLKHHLRYNTAPIYILNLTWSIMLLYNPFICFDIGAILSFLATFSLLYVVPYITNKCPNYIPLQIRSLIGLSIAPWLLTTPVLMLNFNQLPTISILCNLILMSLIEFLVCLGFIATAIGFICFPIALICHQVSYVLIYIIVVTAQWFSTIPLAQININQPLLLLLSCGCSIIILKRTSLTKQHYYIYAICIPTIIYGSVLYQTQTHCTISMLDVGQGDSTLIEYKNITMLIDTGAPYDKYHGPIMKQVLQPVLQAKGINSIDYLILTHFDSDHAGNFNDLQQHFRIKNIIHNGNLTNYLTANNITLKNNPNIYHLCNNDKLTYQNLSLQFFQACHQKTQTKNNQSLVFQLNYYDTSVLFTGDIEEDTETQLASTHGSHLNSTILKVAHHGSKTSSSIPFVQAVQPQHSVISAGKQNQFGHPHQGVVTRLKKWSQVWQTNLSGAITIILKKNNYKLAAFLN